MTQESTSVPAKRTQLPTEDSNALEPLEDKKKTSPTASSFVFSPNALPILTDTLSPELPHPRPTSIPGDTEVKTGPSSSPLDEKKSTHASPKTLTFNTPPTFDQYELAAYEGDTTAQVSLGRCYERGQGVTADLKKARYWYQAAAAQGNPLGVFYDQRLENPTAHVMATVHAYRLAAEAGNACAHYYLGRCYETGYGVTKDVSYALYCFQMAIDHHPKARTAYQRLLSTSPTRMPVSSIPILENGDFKQTALKKLGGGGQGEVYQDQWRDEAVAIKYFSTPLSDVQQHIQHLSDAKTNQSLYLTQIKAVCLTPPCVVLEYVPGKNLADFLQTHPDITWLDRYRLAHDIIQGLAYLHQHKLLHRDLKSTNPP
jgi:hypothetical protein